MSPEYLIQTYGYLALFVGTFLEGETILLIAAFAATPGQGLLKLHWAILAAFLGSFAGDETAFFVGRFKGKALLAGRVAWQARAERVYRLLERHSTWIILGFRFMYGLRNITPFALGMSGVRTRRFLGLNALGATLWALTYGLAGYLCGTVAETLIGDIKRYQVEVLAGLAAAGVGVWLVGQVRKRRAGRELGRSKDSAGR